LGALDLLVDVEVKRFGLHLVESKIQL